MSPKLWTDEYFIDQIESFIKTNISMKVFVIGRRKPTKEEYESIFAEWVKKMTCEVNEYDLGIYEE